MCVFREGVYVCVFELCMFVRVLKERERERVVFVRPRQMCVWLDFSKASFIVIFYEKFSSELTFHNFDIQAH